MALVDDGVAEREVVAQQPSTELGAKAKRLTLKSIDLLLLTNLYETTGDRAAIDGRRNTAERWYRRCDRQYKVYVRTTRRTARAWARAGFKP